MLMLDFLFSTEVLVTNYGEGLQNGRGGGGYVNFYPYEKGGGEY